MLYMIPFVNEEREDRIIILSFFFSMRKIRLVNRMAVYIRRGNTTSKGLNRGSK